MAKTIQKNIQKLRNLGFFVDLKCLAPKCFLLQCQGAGVNDDIQVRIRSVDTQCGTTNQGHPARWSAARSAAAGNKEVSYPVQANKVG